MKLSIIIPAYNEEKTIEKMLSMVQAIALEVKKEIIVVDDGSTDATANLIKKYIGKKRSDIVFIQHDKNAGKGAAVKTGLQKATGDFAIIQDADMEYNPAYIPSLLEPIYAKSAQVVYGTRLRRFPNIFKEEKHFLFLLHYFGNRFLSLITSILYGQWLTDMETGYKLFPVAVTRTMKLRSRSFDFEPEITAKLLKRGFTIVELPITTVPRGYDQGKKLNTVRDGLIALWTLLKYRFVE